MLIQCRYKYVICSKHNNGIMWEPGPNRAMSPVLTIGNSVVLTIDDQFRVHMHCADCGGERRYLLAQ